MNKKLYRVEENKVIAGVCGGIAEYFNIDVSIVRLATVVVGICAFVGVVAYIAAAFIVPTKSSIDNQ